MPTERFSLNDFQSALPEARNTGMDRGEYVFEIDIDAQRTISIRSSIGSSGFADDTGDDSIRLSVLSRSTGKSLSNKADAYTQRISGWQSRVRSKIDMLTSLAQQAGSCSVCREPLSTLRVVKPGPNHGRWFASCSNRDHRSFKWLDPTRKPSQTRTQSPEPIVQSLSKNLSDLGFEPLEPTPSPSPASSSSFLDALSDLESSESKAPEKLAVPVRAISSPDLSHLNSDQTKIVVNLCAGAQVVEACPGSGKTKTIEHLIAHMVSSGFSPARIGAFTFSVKASQEMRARIARTVWPDISDEEIAFFTNPKRDEDLDSTYDRSWVDQDPMRVFLVDWCCTIHALCYRLLKATGRKPKVLSGRLANEASSLIKDSIKELDWDESPKTVRKCISTAILDLVVPGNSETYFYDMMITLGGPMFAAPKLAEIYKRYMRFMKKHDLVDFDMMQAEVYRLMKYDAGFRDSACSLFDYIIVDEFQDTSDMQAEILWTMARQGNFLGVGDVDQSMYAFRGAVPDVLRGQFEHRWQNVTRFGLETNYRSTQSIVRVADRLIKSNYHGDLMKYLKRFMWRQTAPIGSPVDLIRTETFEELGREAARLIIDSEKPGDWFVLSRTRAECAAIHTALISAKIPAINKSGGLLFGAPHIRKVLAYARLACDYNGARNDLDILKEIANVATKSFIAPLTRRRHLDTCKNDKPWINCGCPVVLEEGLDRSNTRYYGAKSVEEAGGWDGIIEQQYETNRGGYPTLSSKGARDLVGFVNLLALTADDAKQTLTLIIDDCVLPWLAAEEGIDDADLSENGKQEDFTLLLSMTKEGQSMTQYLDEIEALSKGNKDGDESESVLVGTIHWSKGAERPRVIANATRLPIIPPVTKKNHIPSGRPPTLEEERRLLYVAITRAKEAVYVLKSKTWQGQPSSDDTFIEELGL